jgi:hypothetical protein
MILRVVAPLPLATVMASPLMSTSPPRGGAGVAASGHRRAGRCMRGGCGGCRAERRTLPATLMRPPRNSSGGERQDRGRRRWPGGGGREGIRRRQHTSQWWWPRGRRRSGGNGSGRQ